MFLENAADHNCILTIEKTKTSLLKKRVHFRIFGKELSDVLRLRK